MQRHPTSLFLLADAYRQELLADAARVRPCPRPAVGGPVALPPFALCRRAIGAALVRVGQHLRGPSRASATDPALAPPDGLGCAR